MFALVVKLNVNIRNLNFHILKPSSFTTFHCSIISSGTDVKHQKIVLTFTFFRDKNGAWHVTEENPIP